MVKPRRGQGEYGHRELPRLCSGGIIVRQCPSGHEMNRIDQYRKPPCSESDRSAPEDAVQCFTEPAQSSTVL